MKENSVLTILRSEEVGATAGEIRSRIRSSGQTESHIEHVSLDVALSVRRRPERFSVFKGFFPKRPSASSLSPTDSR